MNDIAALETADIARLDGLASEARMYVEAMAMNVFQIGRVFTEAKKLVKHDEWEKWLQKNAGMSERSAQQMMAVYRRYSGNPALSGVDKSKLFKMLALPSGKEDDFLSENDIDAMTSRQVEEAVKKVRDEVQAELDREREARRLAEQKLEEAKEAPSNIPDEVKQQIQDKDVQLGKYKTEVERLGETSKELISEQRRLTSTNTTLTNDVKELEGMLADKQRDYDALQAELLNAQSAVAKGDADRVISEQLGADEFASAVRQFIGTVSSMPHMGAYFAQVQEAEWQCFDLMLKTVEGWAQGARAALNTVKGEQVYV